MRHWKTCIFFLVGQFFLLPLHSIGQTAEQKLKSAYAIFEKDEQVKFAISSLYVVDAKTGKVVFEKNSRIGLAPASTLKLLTTVTAFELLGPGFRYVTDFYAFETAHAWNLIIQASGDPTLGSWRWKSTSTDSVISRLVSKIISQRKQFMPGILISDKEWNDETIPGGWIWEDIGNYYGAGAASFNWRENQYDVFLSSGPRIGDSVTVVATNPPLPYLDFVSYATAAPSGTGDNAYIFYDPTAANKVVIRGTIPVNQKKFSISGSIITGQMMFSSMLADTLKIEKFNIRKLKGDTAFRRKIHSEVSPSLDSIVYYFNQRSVNLYGEALLKTMGLKKKSHASTDAGISVIKDFWKQKGLDEEELHIYDGSGLSPQNRITTHAQIEILRYAYSQAWYPAFYHSLPVYNRDMKLKSGTISRVKAFTGIHRSKAGREYLIAFIVNNYSGSASSVVNKMYKVLDVLR